MNLIRPTVGGAAAVIILGLTAGCAGDGQTLTGRPLPVASASNPTAEAATTTTADTGLRYTTPTKRDFRITLKILTKDCFGDAGCNLTYRPQLTNLSWVDFDPSITYDVTYEVRGGQDGAQLDTLQVTGSQYQSSEGAASTATSAAKLTAVIISVNAE